ncbi:unnamed protein product [Cochlearia groenlandica]
MPVNRRARNPTSSSASSLQEKATLKAIRRAFGTDCMDPDPDRLIHDQSLSYGFDLEDNDYPLSRIRLVYPCLRYSYEEALFCRFGLACHNFQTGTNFKFVRFQKSRVENTQCADCFITLEAKDPEAGDSVFSFQTAVRDFIDSDGIATWTTLASRVKPKCRTVLNDEWIIEAVDDFYKSPLPQWLSDGDLARDSNKYYVVQESDFHENDWLHLFAEIAFYTKVTHQFVSPPLEIKRVVVDSKEEYITQGCEKLKADNAIFYISYRYNGDNTWGWSPDHKAVIRKTMDGVPEHMCLEIADRTTGEE